MEQEKGIFEKTGKTIDEWVLIAEQSKLKKHMEIVNYLKNEHLLTHGYANLVAHKANRSDAASFEEDELVTNQYNGKENLKSLYDALIATIKDLGDDITITPKKDSVSIICKRQFALIKPATKTRIDLGLKYKDKPITERLGNSGPFGAMCTHRVQLTDIKEIDKELVAWLKEAYEQSV